MNSLMICLSFTHLSAQTQNHIPPHISEGIKTRIASQFVGQYPRAELHFDNKNCPNKGHYWYTSNSIVLEAENQYWSGELSQSLASVLDGEKIYFASRLKGEVLGSQPTDIMAALQLKEHYDKKERSFMNDTPSWVWWGLATAIAIGAGAYAVSRSGSGGSKGPFVGSAAPTGSTQPSASMQRGVKF